MEEVKSWFECVLKEKLTEFLKSKHLYEDSKIENDILTVLCYSRLSEEEWTETYTPFGRLKDVKERIFHDLDAAEKEFFQLMYKSNEGKIINGKTYIEAWKEAHEQSINHDYEHDIESIDRKIAELNAQKEYFDNVRLKKSKINNEFMNAFIEQEKNKKSLIVKDMLDKMPEDERIKFLKDNGYIPVKKEISSNSSDDFEDVKNLGIDF